VALNALGPDHRFRTPVYRQGSIDPQGVLEGNLILVAAGDLTLGGRQTSNGGDVCPRQELGRQLPISRLPCIRRTLSKSKKQHSV
jgi:D-alanyl-D-alanine carboxypeptidase